MDLLEVGKIVNTHGLKGEVKIVPWTDSPDVFEDLEYVILKNRSGNMTLNIKGIKRIRFWMTFSETGQNRRCRTFEKFCCICST